MPKNIVQCSLLTSIENNPLQLAIVLFMVLWKMCPVLELLICPFLDSGSDSSHKQSLHFCIEGINEETNKFRDVAYL